MQLKMTLAMRIFKIISTQKINDMLSSVVLKYTETSLKRLT